jgi:hypothetical protein
MLGVIPILIGIIGIAVAQLNKVASIARHHYPSNALNSNLAGFPHKGLRDEHQILYGCWKHGAAGTRSSAHPLCTQWRAQGRYGVRTS